MEYNALVPELLVTDLEASLDFYLRVIGFNVEYERPDDDFVFLSYGGAQLMLQEATPDDRWKTAPLERPFGRGINFEIDTPDVIALEARVRATGWPIFQPIETKTYGSAASPVVQRQFLVQDPDGYLLRFSQ